MSFCVSKMAPELVGPSEPTPSGHLPLSTEDDTPMVMYYVELILVFGEGKEPVKVIREALAKALVPYYPVAGRLVANSGNDNRLQVALTGEGALFVEASVDCTLQDVNYVQKQPLMIPKEQLLPSLPGEGDRSAGTYKLHPVPFMMQVTQFNCGGFTVGIKFNHTMFDGVGAGQLMAAVGEMARGLREPTIEPVWCRESIPARKPTIPTSDDDPTDPSLHFTKKTSDNHTKLQRCIIDLPLDHINQLTHRFMRETGERCTSFEIAIAKLWQCRTRAIDLKPDVTVTLSFPVNIRRLILNASEGTGYYGNCLYVVVIEAPSERIATASLFEIVKLIKQGKESMPSKYGRMLEGLIELPPMGGPTYDKLAVMDWRRLGFSDTDYGWGTPDYVVPLLEHPWSFGSAYLVNSPPPMTGIRLIMQSVAEEHFEDFLKGMNDSS